MPPEIVENVAGASGNTGISTGDASPEMIAAAMASEVASPEETSSGSAADALARAAESAEDTSQVADGVVKPVSTGAAKGPQTATGQAQTGAKNGPVPFDRHDAAVKNARAEGAAEALKPYAWAKDVTPEAWGTASQLMREIITDTPAFVAKLAAECGLKVVPATAEATATGTKAETGGKFTLPKGRLQSEDGTRAFSEDQVGEILTSFAESLRGELRTEFSGQLKPVLDDREKAAKAAEQTAIREEVRQTVAETMAELRSAPHYQIDDGKGGKMDNPKIAEYFFAIPAAARQANPIAAAYRAYQNFYNKEILPTIGQTSQAQVREENRRKVAASQGAHPSTTNASTMPKEIKGVGGLAKRMEEMAAAAAND